MGRRLTIEGRVQGVGYRVAFAEEAIALGLCGWVRNRRDGSVEACVDGEAQAIEAIILWAKRGPPAAQVLNVTIEELGVQASSDGTFRIFADVVTRAVVGVANRAGYAIPQRRLLPKN